MTRHEEPTSELRFLQRQNRRVLQQKWRITTLGENVRIDNEWRDVPFIREDDKK